MKIIYFRASNKLLKTKFLINSITTINLGIKKNNYNKLEMLIANIKLLHENLSKLKEISNNSSNIHDFFEINNKSAYLIDMLKNETPQIKIVKFILCNIDILRKSM